LLLKVRAANPKALRRETHMGAILMVGLFIVAMGALNIIEFGRLD
jgi:hypothetical protein